jgi:hypothetical protein
MNRKTVTAVSLAAIFFALAILPGSAQADRKIFAYTYPYMTLPQGAAELEHYLDVKFEEIDDPNTPEVDEEYEPSWKHQVEFEYGITDRWDFGLYQVFEQAPYSPMSYTGTKLRTRVRLAEQGDWPVDLGFYLEGLYYTDAIGAEERIIIAKTINKFESSINLKFEQKAKDEGEKQETELEFIPMIGLGYHVARWFAVGAEYQAKLEYKIEKENGETEEEMGDWEHYVGPVVSVSGGNFWWTVGYQHLVSDVEEASDFMVRSVLSVGF